MVNELHADAERSSSVHLSVIGYSAVWKRPIYLVKLGVDTAKAVRIMVLCRQHGDEPSGTEGALQVINELSQKGASKVSLKSACFYIIPMVNPDGAEADTRLNGARADLNRDWGIFNQPETVAVQTAIEKIRPNFILDVHSWDMIDPFQQVCLEGPRDKKLAGSLLLPIADLQARAAYALTSLTQQDVAATTYGEYSDGNLAHRYFMRHDHIASLLFETGPGPNYGESLIVRTALVRTMLIWLISDTSRHAADWYRLEAAEPKLARPEYMASATANSGGSAIRMMISEEPRPALWPVLFAGCLLLAWIILANKQPAEPTGDRLPARFRRLSSTSVSVYEIGRKQRYRNSFARLTAISHLEGNGTH
jgi:hypothetical protein